MSTGGDPKSCTCRPSYYSVVWDRVARKPRKTRRFRRVIEARNARHDLAEKLRTGGLPEAAGGPKLSDAMTRFAVAAGRVWR